MATNESRRRKVHRFRSLALFLSIMGSIGLIWGDLFVIQVDRGLRWISELRSLGIYHANNNTCDFEPTLAPDFIPDDSFTNTIIVGYPGGDKRTVLRQMEAMTTLSGRDAWDFQFLGMTRQPFIKTNYPHHEGIWGFQDHGDQVILVVRNLRRTIDEYHDILSDIDYAKTWQEATDKIPMLYHGSVVNEDLAAWRDERVMDEIGWYGWLIDYWMEGGLLRDYFDHKITTQQHFKYLRRPEIYTYGELQYEVNICPEEEPLPLEYDPRCANVSGGCEPVLLLSGDRLMDPVYGKAENRKIGKYLSETNGVKNYLVPGGDPAYDCFYDKMISDNPDGNTAYGDYRLRADTDSRKHPLSTRMLTKMRNQLDRLIAKYSSPDDRTGIDWTAKETAQYLVELLTEHRADLQQELDEQLAENPDGVVWEHAPKAHWVIFPKQNCSIPQPERLYFDDFANG